MTTPTLSAESESLGAQPTRRSRRRLLRKIFLRVWLPLVALFFFYIFYSFRAAGFDDRILSTDADVTVVHAPDSMTFTPARGAQPAALIFIPGSMVDPTAYAPLARSIAGQGYTVIIPKLPLRFAPLDSQREAVVAQVERIVTSRGPGTRWVVAGHSLGGVLACRIARDHPALMAGLVLIGTTHPRDFDLSGLTLDVTKICATNDGLASPAEIKANASKLPAHTRWVVIEGGNHSQFGHYGLQLGDHRAAMSREQQQQKTVEALLDALHRADTAG